MIAPPTSSNPLSPSQTLVDGRVPQKYSVARRYVLLLIFCLAQFLDSINNSALFSAIPDLENSLCLLPPHRKSQLCCLDYILTSGLTEWPHL